MNNDRGKFHGKQNFLFDFCVRCNGTKVIRYLVRLKRGGGREYAIRPCPECSAVGGSPR